MAKVTFRSSDGSEAVVGLDTPMSIMRAAVTHNVAGIVGECGGNAMCATCHVYVREEFLDRLPEIEDEEEEMLDGVTAPRSHRSRLSCQLVLDDALDGIVVDIPEAQ
ncbi:2Fe-2S iron-sulfur cluster-binding protein [Streptomyces sp. NPDC091217]|uniref:2Fe-2S iron-sulfur cluster-binding protein n=1 Tax=Streptomyces sp. NPDC091217 TaxID=3365975 RepID=UPI00380D092D